MLVYSTLAHTDRHNTPEWHPERAQRLQAVDLALCDVFGTNREGVTMVGVRSATTAELCLVHPPSYVESLEALCRNGGGELDPDTPLSIGSEATARLAVGAGLSAIDALRAGAGEVAFVAVRPPGHHARRARGMGFCLYNNIAVVAASLTLLGERVLIVDWDVHHGNGTQEIFWDDPAVMYVSTHQSPFYPGTGDFFETGGPKARGLTLNLPFPEGTTGDVILRALDEVVAPAVAAFAPTWVLVSAGFDAHRDDPLAGLRLTSGDFAVIAKRVAEFAPRPGRLALLLEGGYDLEALRGSVTATIGALVDIGVTAELCSSGGPGSSTITMASRVRKKLDES